jgi:predicted esterase
MSYQKLLRQMIGVTLVMLLLAGCGAPAATPVSEAPAVTPTPEPPTATFTPIPPTPTPIPPTATPTPEPPTAMPTVTVAPSEFIASKVEDVVGIWETQFMGAVAYMQYEADGTSKLTDSLENLKKGIIGIPGTFWFEGTVFHVEDAYGEGTYEVRVQKEGDIPVHLDFVEINDPNPDRAGDLTAGMTWVAPSLETLKIEEIPLDEQYLIYLPKEYEDQQKPWPLLLFLHGVGQREAPPELIEQGKNFPFIIVAPVIAMPEWSADFVDSVLNEVTERYRVDEDRIYVTGLSMGGFGTWTIALAYPERFAAIAPICGGGDPEMVESIKHLPVWVFHGAKDDTIPIERAQEMVDALERVGGNVKFTIYPEGGHDVWRETYNNPELYEWFLKHHR